jgi:uncharacterized lipoprotein YddW (UPF0748 family)
MALFRRILLLLILLSATLAPAQTARTPRYQALWIDSFHDGYFTPQQTKKLVDTARRYRFNTLFVQVSRGGDAFYNSQLAPRAPQVQRGYDPLQHIIELAHDTRGGQQRLEVHAWFICYRASTTPKITAGSILAHHPEWRMISHDGKRDFDGHVFADPGVPGVQQYYVELVSEVTRKYDVDGIHLDRIRYPETDWGYNKYAVERFKRLNSRHTKPKPDDPLWQAFRRMQISDLMKRIYAEVKRLKPGVKVSAATIAEGSVEKTFLTTQAYAKYAQDWPTWLREGWLDINCPMIYKRDHVAEQQRDFDRWRKYAVAASSGRQLIVGQAAYLNSTQATVKQNRMALLDPKISGVALYSFAVANKQENIAREKVFEQLNKQSFWEQRLTPPLPWVERPRHGLLSGLVKIEGQSADGVMVRVQTLNGSIRVRTDANGFFAVCRITLGECQLAVEGVASPETPRRATIVAGKATHLNLVY